MVPWIHPPRHLKNLDVFVFLNLILFSVKGVLRSYPLFLAFYGADRVGEFSVYAVGLLAAMLGFWAVFRRYHFDVPLLVLAQVGILIHFAGAFVILDGRRLYDCFFWGMGYDKFVHFTNSFVVSILLRRLFVIQKIPRNAINRLFIVWIALGLGGLVEIVEYGVVLNYPRNGVGGYDNNMQDLIANLVGGLSYWGLCSVKGLPSWVCRVIAPDLAAPWKDRVTSGVHQSAA
jgi:hypothetical protein